MEQKTMMKEVYFDIKDLLPIAMTLVVLGIGVSYGLNVMSDVRDDFTADTEEYNATTDAIEGVAKIPEKLPLIVTVIVAAVIIGILLRYLAAPFMR